MAMQFYNASILRNHQMEKGELWVDGAHISSPTAKPSQSIDMQGKIIAPGFIDLQINGAFGIDISTNPERVDELAQKLGQYGVTSFLATLVSLPQKNYHHHLPLLKKHIGTTKGAELLGMHLEGPFFNPKQLKAHLKANLRYPIDFDFYGDMTGVKLVTLAPEISGAVEWIKRLRAQGIVVSAGHTEATFDEMNQAITAGATLATHLFNAMGPFHHRQPGVVGSVLHRQGFFYSVIADGVHVDPAVLAIAWKCQPEGLILISDAIASCGMGNGRQVLAGQDVCVERVTAKIEGTEVIAGSIVGMDQMVRNLKKYTGASDVEVLEAASLRPASVLGVQKRKGNLSVGADADFVVLDKDLNILATYAKGQCTYEKG